MKKLRRIIIGDKNYPIKIDLNVLEHIQENYGSINQFEMDILGLKHKKDADGNPVYTEDGKAMMYKTEPSVKAIKMVLPAMINEGIAVEVDNNHAISLNPVTEKEILRECTISYELLAKMIHEEFKQCFEVKN